jgi:hypothetical protein
MVGPQLNVFVKERNLKTLHKKRLEFKWKFPGIVQMQVYENNSLL